MKRDFLISNNCVALAKNKRDLPIINPCYFGNVQITSKNDKTIFLISGDGSKNFRIVVDSVKRLISSGNTNFVVYITGRHTHDELPEELNEYIKFLGYVSFSDLYSIVEQSDFILPCLDPSIPKHQWYLKDGTSGAFQLSYGFLKPMILSSAFAQKALVDNSSAILYDNNSELYDSMLKAINLNNDEYKSLQDGIKCAKDKLYNLSLENMKNIIKANFPPTLLFRTACLGFLTFKNFDLAKYKIISFNKQRVDFILDKKDILPKELMYEYGKDNALVEERWITQYNDIFNQKNVKALIMDSFSEMADKRFKSNEGQNEICALYSEIKKSSDFYTKYSDMGLIDENITEEQYSQFFAKVINQYGEIPIIYLIFPSKFETRELYIARTNKIREILKSLKNKFNTLKVYEPEYIEQNQDGYTYHFSDKTYKLLAERISKDYKEFQLNKFNNVFEFIYKKEVTLNKKKKIILFSFIKISY